MVKIKNLIDRELLRPSVFGMFDGLTSLLGVLIPLLGFAHLLVFTTCIGLAVSSAISMGLGEFLSSDRDTSKKTRAKSSVYMGLFTGIGCFLPVIPFLFTGGLVALGISAVIYLLLTFVVAFMKSGELGWKESIKQTLLVSVFAIALVVVVTLVLPVPLG